MGGSKKHLPAVPLVPSVHASKCTVPSMCHHLPPLMSPKILTIKDLRVATTSNAAPSSIFAVTNSTATLPNYHAPDTAQLMIVHPSIAHPLILLPMMVHQKMVQLGAAFGGTICNGNTHHGTAYHATMYDGTAYDSANASGTAFDCASNDSVADAAALP